MLNLDYRFRENFRRNYNYNYVLVHNSEKSIYINITCYDDDDDDGQMLLIYNPAMVIGDVQPFID